MNMKRVIKFVVLAIVVGVIASASYQVYQYNRKDKETNEKEEFLKNENKTKDEDVSLVNTKDNVIENDVSAVVDNVMPSIVAINSTVEESVKDFFGREYRQEAEGSGSGFIIGQNNKELLIVTNNHVIDNASQIEIVFNDGTKAKATLRGANAAMDVAVVCVSFTDLTKDTQNHIKIATIGNSNNIQLGDLAIAIGNALGYGQSVTVGYISAISREVDIEGKTMELMQTDAAINPGNSGGALLNARGEVIGINTVKLIGANVEGIGYAIPISEVLELINLLINRETIKEGSQAYLGIQTQDVTEMYSKGFNMPIGVFVSEVEKESAAEKSGIKVGDIITAVNGIPVESQLDLMEILNYIEANSTGTITTSSLENGEYTQRTLEVVFDGRK